MISGFWIVAVALFLIAQGALGGKHTSELQRWARLTALSSGLFFACAGCLLASGSLVLSAELGLLIVQQRALVWLVSCVTLGALSLWLASSWWRRMWGIAPSYGWLAVLGVLVLVAVGHALAHPIGEHEDRSQRVFALGYASPMLMVIGWVSLVDWLISALRIADAEVRRLAVALGGLAAAAGARLASAHLELILPPSLRTTELAPKLVVCAMIVAAGVTLHALLLTWVPRARAKRRWVRVSIALGCFVSVWIANGIATFVRGELDPPTERILSGSLVVLAAILGLGVVRSLRHAPLAFTTARHRHLVAASFVGCALVVIGLFVHATRIPSVEPSLHLLIAALACTVAADIGLHRPLRVHGWPLLLELRSGVRRAARTLSLRVRARLASTPARLQPAAAANGKSEEKLLSTRNVLIALTSLFSLMCIEQWPNRGSVVVYPFEAIGTGDDKAGLGVHIAKLLTESMIEVSNVLASDIQSQVGGVPNHAGLDRKPSVTIRSSQTRIATSSGTLDWGPLRSCSLSSLLGPVERLLHGALEVTTVQGSVSRVADGYEVVAEVSSGQLERVTDRDLATVLKKLAWKLRHAERADRRGEVPASFDAYQALAVGKQDLLHNASHTRVGGDSSRLASAVDALREAVALDRTCAATHYQLGLALRAQGDLGAAIRAFQTAAELSPDFDAAQDAVAWTYTEYQYPSYPQILAPPAFDVEQQLRQAVAVWERLLRARGSSAQIVTAAHFGLCRVSQQKDGAHGGLDYVRQFYHCSQAREHVQRLPEHQVQPTREELLATVANETAVLLQRLGYAARPAADSGPK
ncbi:MAG: tetratricopeptide repeat protein, partial [Polyangiales bacterium]